eukprot:CAMPEP_0170458920 /NCGR_PEP_ID=MMETSP0123-20130129/5753_1 /TAXON_ID=182087 /ORGANISM="Favella ehrenbergii, Strain Fehren 1" /LENGTH=63 /DNA_ID=CAMNT_0010723277 /DNA_START=387 /DNA_END=575 /DNA_ORIENTATION=-
MTLSRGQDMEKVIDFKQKALPLYEEWAAAADGKYLFGTEDLTLFDLHCASMWEILYLWDSGVW